MAPMTPSAGDLLRDARKAAGLTQREVAQRSGVSQPHVSAYETGRRQPTLPTIARLIMATGHELVLGLETPAYQPLRLAEIAPLLSKDQSGARGGRWLWVREFLRGFQDDAADAEERSALIARQPPGTRMQEWDAVLAAVAEHLSFHHDLPCPPWVHGSARFAGQAWFLSDLPSQRAWAVETSPASFRRRNLFILPTDLQVV